MPFISLHSSQVAHQAALNSGFCGMKRLGVFLLPAGWDASQSQGYLKKLLFLSQTNKSCDLVNTSFLTLLYF